ncbi:MAG TPA: NAD(P)/FAD-dependent oxidoreductase [Bryobacteraceae bacterium]
MIPKAVVLIAPARYSRSIRKRVIILGGGFGGLYAARALRHAPVDITLIDRRNFHLFQPLMYQIATGSLSPADISAPLRGILSGQRNIRVLLGEAADIDPHNRQLTLKDGGVFPYDSLIVATGSRSSYYGNDQWQKLAPSLKSVEEATAIRHKILFAFEAAERIEDPDLRRAWLTFVIVGAGTTGVELSGALCEIARHTLKNDFRSIRPEDAQIFLLDGSDRVLPGYPPDLSGRAEQSLTKLGTRVRLGVQVFGVDEDGVSLHNRDGAAERIPAKTVLWAGGVTVTEFGHTLARRTEAPTDRQGHIKVNPDLTIPNWPEIFAIGDLVRFEGPDGKALPGVAQVAMQGGAYAAKAIQKRLTGHTELPPFHYFDKGDLAVIGRAAAVARIFGVHLSGWIAWMVWLFVHLMYLVQFQNRVIVFIQWGFQFITFGRGARLITGTAVPDSDAEP